MPALVFSNFRWFKRTLLWYNVKYYCSIVAVVRVRNVTFSHWISLWNISVYEVICYIHSHVSSCLFISLRWFPAPVQIGPGAHPASCAAGTGLSPAGKAAGAWPLPPTHPSSAEAKERVELCLYSPWAFMACYRLKFAFFMGEMIHTYIHTNFSVRIQVRWIFKNIDVEWIQVAQNSAHWWACVNAVTRQVERSMGNFLTNINCRFLKKDLASRDRLHEVAVCGMIVAWYLE
jgi:hypothetical protein